LETALEYAREVYASNNVSQADADEAVALLDTAVKGLKKTGGCDKASGALMAALGLAFAALVVFKRKAV